MTLDFLLVIISATLTSLSMPGFLSEIFVWFSLVFLIKAICGKGILKSMILSYIYGLILLMTVCFWQLPTLAIEIPKVLGRYGTFGGVIAFILAALFIGAPPYLIFGFIVGVGNKLNLYKYSFYPLFIASSYTIMEFFREIGPLAFTGARLSDALYKNTGLLQIASITGTLGLVFMISFVNALIFSIWKKEGGKYERIGKILTIFGGIYIISSFVSNAIPISDSHDMVRILAFQTNLTQEHKYSLSMREQVDFAMKMMEKARNEFGMLPDLYVFPEAILLDDIEYHNELKGKLFRKVKEIGIPIVIGGVRRRNKSQNCAFFIKDGNVDYYAKIKLTPFAEILPFPKIFGKFSFLKLLDYYTPGDRYSVFKLENTKFSVQICFESFFPRISREFARNGAEFLVIITNDGWFKYRAALIQHFSEAIFRAVENGKYVIQVANTGITGLIDPYGRVLKGIRTNIEGMELFDIAPNSKVTVYTRFGDSIIVIPSFILIILSIYMSISKRKRRG